MTGLQGLPQGKGDTKPQFGQMLKPRWLQGTKYHSGCPQEGHPTPGQIIFNLLTFLDTRAAAKLITAEGRGRQILGANSQPGLVWLFSFVRSSVVMTSI